MNCQVTHRFRWLLSALIVGAVIAAGSASSASAAYPGSNGLIAFDRGGQIYSINANGTGLTDLSNTALYSDYNPQWSADGQTIVFERCCVNGLSQIFTMSANGSNQTDISNDAFDDYDPSISPNGTQVAFDRNGDLFTMSINGSNKVQITSTSEDSNPKWSPDGTKLVFYSYTGYPYYTDNIETVNTSGGARTNITSSSECADNYNPDWSSDGGSITYTRYDDCNTGYENVWTMNNTGGSQTQISSGNNDYTPVYSPDDTMIAFDRGGDVYTMTANGGSQVAIAVGNDPSWQPTTATVPPVSGLNADTSTQGQVALTWTNPTGSNVNGDVVRRGASGSCPASASAGTAIGGTTLRASQIDTSVSAGSSYCYTVFVTDGSGHYSTAVTITVNIPSAGLQPPTNLNASTATPGQVALTWTNPGTGEAGDVVRRGSSTSCPAAANAGTGIGSTTLRTSQTDTSVTEGVNYCYSVFTTDGTGGYSTPAEITVSVPIPANGPTITLFTRAIQLKQQVSTSNPPLVPVLLRWSATSNSGDGICSYTVQQSLNGGAYTSVNIGNNVATSVIVFLASGTSTTPNSYTFKLTAQDCNNSTTTTALTPFTVSAIPENASKIKYSTGWTRTADASAVGGFVERATKAGASATLTYTANTFALVAPIGPIYGQVKIYADGVLKKTLNLNASTKKARLEDWSMTFPTLAQHTIKLVVAGTAGHPAVDLDAIIALANN